MEYVQPVGGLANDPYLDANPVGGIEGSPVPAAAIEHPMRELVALITDAGLVPTDASLSQVATAVRTLMQKQAASISVAGGTADAITAAYTPVIAALVNGMTLYVRAASANATATPTFTPASPTIAAKAIVKGNNLPLVAGDIAGAGHWVELRYDSVLDKWVIANPAKGVSGGEKQIQSVSATVAANALTLGLNPTTLDFRAASLTNGVPNTRTVAAALSLVVPSGATLGQLHLCRLVLLAIDNAGTVELAVVNLAGGVNLDETTLISTTAISATSDSASVIYSTVARASVPFRVVGMIDIAETVAGTWATAPTTIQGQGGQALAALQSLGFGQTQQVLTGSRSLGTTYYNTTGRPIWIEVYAFLGATHVVQLIKNGVTVQNVGNNTTTSTNYAVSTIVLPGQSYSVTASGGPSYVWTETR